MAIETNNPEMGDDFGGEGLETRVYELGFHLDPELAQEDLKKAYQAVRDRIAAVGTIVAEGEPTKIPLAYTISRMETTGRRDFYTAFFCWIAYETTGQGHEDIATMARENTQIIRFLDVRTTKDAAQHSAEMQEIFAQAAAAAAAESFEDDDASEASAEPAQPAREEEVA
jgi:ribosomal protein S6